MKSSILLNIKNINMKLFKRDLSYWTFLLCIILLSAACGKESEDDMMDDNQVPEMGFTINADEYETPNAYLIFHTVLQYDPDQMMDVAKVKNHFSFLFMDGKAISNDGHILYSVDTKQSSYHHFSDIGDVNLADDVQSIVIMPGTYTQSPSTTTRINISDIVEDITEDGVSYGDPRLVGINYLLANQDVASFKINSIDINYDTMAGIIDCEYSIDSALASGEIVGRFIGSFNILIE
jgi:hypothetical protein